jgi:hypothetical protein
MVVGAVAALVGAVVALVWLPARAPDVDLPGEEILAVAATVSAEAAQAAATGDDTIEEARR